MIVFMQGPRFLTSTVAQMTLLVFMIERLEVMMMIDVHDYGYCVRIRLSLIHI